MKYKLLIVPLFVGALLIPGTAPQAAENIDPLDQGQQYAWSEGRGWVNLEPYPDSGLSVAVKSFELRGWMWTENFGWISMSCENTADCCSVIIPDADCIEYEVKNDGQGNLSGFAYAYGNTLVIHRTDGIRPDPGFMPSPLQISFSCTDYNEQPTDDFCAINNYGVYIDLTTDPLNPTFSGKAWAARKSALSTSTTTRPPSAQSQAGHVMRRIYQRRTMTSPCMCSDPSRASMS